MNIFNVIALWRDINRVRKAVKEGKMNTIKDGVKTSEFWMGILGALIPVLNSGLGLHLPTEAIMSIAGIAIAYIFGRSIVKKGAGESGKQEAGKGE